MLNLQKRHNSGDTQSLPEKRSKIRTTKLEDLSDKIQLKTFAYLSTKDFICYGQVSKRTQRICFDDCLENTIP